MKTINMNIQTEKLKGTTVTTLKIVIALLFIAWNLNAIGQDTIVMKNESLILSKISEVSALEVKYVKSDNANGVSYVTRLSEVSKIKYQNGLVEIYNVQEPIMLAKKEIALENQKAMRLEPRMMNEKEMFMHMREKNNPEINSHITRYKVSKGCENIGFVAIPCAVMGAIYYATGVLGAAWGGENSDSNIEMGNVFMGAGAVCLSTSIYFGIDKKIQKKKAVSLYNELYTKGY